MCLAVLGDAVGEGPKAPGLGLHDLTTVIANDFCGVFRERIDLGLGEVLTREENMLVERHVCILSFWPIADAAQCKRPSGCLLKSTGARSKPRASAAPMARWTSKCKPRRSLRADADLCEELGEFIRLSRRQPGAERAFDRFGIDGPHAAAKGLTVVSHSHPLAARVFGTALAKHQAFRLHAV